MKVVITGCSGFIGARIYEKLVSEGFYCIGVTRQKLLDRCTVVENYSESPVGDILIHCAEPSVVSQVNLYSQERLAETIETSKALLLKPYKRIIYLSTGSLYGDKITTPHHPSDETFLPDNYRIMKKKIEEVTLMRHGTVLRLANVYGKGMSEFNVVSTVLRQIFKREPIKLHSVYPVRDFVYIEDIVSLVVKACCRDANGIYNVGTGVGHSIRQLVDLLQKICGTQLDVICDRGAQQALKSVNILRIRESIDAFDWSPKYDLQDGMSALAREYNFLRGEGDA